MPTWPRAPWRLTLAILLHSSRGEESVECDGWARTGECKANPDFMQQHCPLACRGQPVIDPNGEIEQCAGWADQGECEKNPGFMRSEGGASCSRRRRRLRLTARLLTLLLITTPKRSSPSRVSGGSRSKLVAASATRSCSKPC